MQHSKIDGGHLDSASECHQFKMADKMAENAIDPYFEFIPYLVICFTHICGCNGD